MQAGEDEQLERDYRRMVNGRKIAETLNLVHGLTGEEEGKRSRGADRACARELSQALSCDDGLGQLVQLLADVDGLLNDFNRAVSEYLSDLEFDEEQLSETENRLNTVNHLKDKYGSTIEEVLAYAEQKNQELDRLLHQEEWLEQKRRELSKRKNVSAAGTESDSASNKGGAGVSEGHGKRIAGYELSACGISGFPGAKRQLWCRGKGRGCIFDFDQSRRAGQTAGGDCKRRRAFQNHACTKDDYGEAGKDRHVYF